METELDAKVEDKAEEKEEEVLQDMLTMSDEDIGKMSLAEVEAATTTDKVAEKDDTLAESDVESVHTDDSDTDDTEEGETSKESTSSEDESEQSDSDESDDVSDAQDATKDQEESASSEDSEDDTKQEVSEDTKKDSVDYKAEHDKLLSPFRANGKDIQVDNVDDAITLMKMGANYNKKMQGLKPNLKLIKMLENNGLLDESKISHLIDLSKKNPDAIKKLIKDSGIDPLDIDVKDDAEYTPNTYTVDDKEVELDTVLSGISDSPKFKDTIDIISNKWDEPSKTMLVDNPGIISVINQHVELGIYDKISAVVDKERMLGKLNGLNDLQAYKQVGDAINAQGGFGSKPESTLKTVTKATTEKKPDDTKLKNRKKAASHTKSTTAKKGNTSFNPLALSDEDFEKEMASGKYM